jgi:hypothetical protein
MPTYVCIKIEHKGITELTSEANVRLQLPNYGGWQHLHPVFHASRIHAYRQRPGCNPVWDGMVISLHGRETTYSGL